MGNETFEVLNIPKARVDKTLSSNAADKTGNNEQVEISLNKNKKIEMPENIKEMFLAMGKDPNSEETINYWINIPEEKIVSMLKEFSRGSVKLEPVNTQTAQDVTLPNENIEVPSVTDEQNIESQELSKTAVVEESPLKQEKSAIGEFNREAFNTADDKSKKEIYANEYAKNKFLYGDSESTKTPEDFAKFAAENPDEYNALLKEAESSFVNKSGKQVKPDELMTRLHASNYLKISLDQFENNPNMEKQYLKGYQEEYIHTYLKHMQNLGQEDSFSDFEKVEFDRINTLVKAANFANQNKNGVASNLCPQEAHKFFNENKDVSPIDAQMAVLKIERAECKAKNQDTEDLDKQIEDINKQSKFYNSLSEEDRKAFGSRLGERSLLQTKIKDGNYNRKDSNVYNKLFANEIGSIEDPKKALEKINLLVKDAYETGDGRTIDKLLSWVAVNRPDIANGLSNVQDNSIATNFAVAKNLDNFKAELKDFNTGFVAKYGESWAKLEKEHPERAKAILDMARTNKSKFASNILIDRSQDPDKYIDDCGKFIEDSNGLTDEEWALKMANLVKNGSSKARALNSSREVMEGLKDPQRRKDVHYLYKHFPNEKELTTNATQTVDLLDKEDQTPAFESVHKFIYDHKDIYSDNEIKGLEKNLANQISNCHKDNQLAMHKDIMTSKFEEVQEYAAKNISKYNEDVQADAIKSTLATGNQKAIDAAISQVNSGQCSPKVAADPKIAAAIVKAEQKYAATIANDIAEFNSNKDTAKTKAEYVQEFVNASPQKQYKMLSDLPDSMRKEAFIMMSRFCPSMLINLINQGYGAQILNTIGLPADVVNLIINTMLNDNNMKNKEIAAKFIEKNPSRFLTSTLDKAYEVMEDKKIDGKPVQAENNVSNKHSKPQDFNEHALFKKPNFLGTLA